ncbi:hypothetical protein ACTHSQ_11315, partial [Neisseria sp. P0009.S008]|uniref:hypothetical protein n=1 Tax=Neisseria sp. P0009.S008 TaxID=3436715 RepID=UPI003F806C29
LGLLVVAVLEGVFEVGVEVLGGKEGLVVLSRHVALLGFLFHVFFSVCFFFEKKTTGLLPLQFYWGFFFRK